VREELAALLCSDRESTTAWIPDHAGDDNYPVIPAHAGIQGPMDPRSRRG
jgi:hypothetical protein